MLDQPFFVPAAIFVAISVPLALQLVPPNRFYGYRTRRAMASRESWFAVNRYAGFAVMIASGVYLAVARALPYHPGPHEDFRVFLVHVVAFGGGVFAALFATLRWARRR